MAQMLHTLLQSHEHVYMILNVSVLASVWVLPVTHL